MTVKRSVTSTVILVIVIVMLTTDSTGSVSSPIVNFHYKSASNSYSDSVSPRVPENKKPLNGSFPDDGCGDNAVRFKNDSYCYKVLTQGPCSSIFYWVTVDPYTYEGICSPRLCGRNKVFVGRDGLCHDINDPYECQGGRRLYYSAYGDPICDCPVGQYPFPTEDDDCVPLFTKGPCQTGEVLIAHCGQLKCGPDVCQAPINYLEDFLLQFVPETGDDDDGAYCHALGTQGPCSSSYELYGYNIFELKGQCVNLEDPSSPYYSSAEENALLDEAYNQANQGSTYLNDPNSTSNQPETTQALYSRSRRQNMNSAGIFQMPSRFPSSLLNPCQLGDRNGNNFKCTNPLVPGRPNRDVSAALNSVFACQGSNFLQANGQCGNNRPAATCGPSYQYVAATNQCRPRFF